MCKMIAHMQQAILSQRACIKCWFLEVQVCLSMFSILHIHGFLALDFSHFWLVQENVALRICKTMGAVEKNAGISASMLQLFNAPAAFVLHLLHPQDAFHANFSTTWESSRFNEAILAGSNGRTGGQCISAEARAESWRGQGFRDSSEFIKPLSAPRSVSGFTLKFDRVSSPISDLNCTPKS